MTPASNEAARRSIEQRGLQKNAGVGRDFNRRDHTPLPGSAKGLMDGAHARVFVDGTDVNLAMVRSGMAWRFEKYSKDGAFQRAQDEARAARRGLWADTNPVSPWEWRKRGGF